MIKPAAVFFDLDGTLVDTAPDLLLTLNILLEENALPTVSLEQIRTHVSAGALRVIQQGLGAAATTEQAETLFPRFLEIYQQHLSDQSRLFDGMQSVLTHLETESICWGIVTNKPSYLTNPLAAALELDRRSCAVISADTTPFKKPHPEPLLEACRRCNIRAEDCIYVGDDIRDIQAGKAAKMRTIAVSYGYIPANEDITSWGADHIIDQAIELLNWI